MRGYFKRVHFDWRQWRSRLGYTQADAEHALGLSRTGYRTLETSGQAPIAFVLAARYLEQQAQLDEIAKGEPT
jgi:DNA-binding XRE family transcriptional regulator